MSCSSKPGMSRPEPSSMSWSRPSPPSNALAVDRAEVVHDDEVVLARAARRRSPGAPSARAARRARPGRPRRRPPASRRADLDALVVAERRGRPHADLDREGERLALRRAGRRGRACGSPTGWIPAASIASRYQRPICAAHGLVEDGLAADALDDDRRRDLALAEAGHAQVAAHARARSAGRSARPPRAAPPPPRARATRAAR